MTIKVFKTHEIADSVWESIAKSFNIAFSTTMSAFALQQHAIANEYGYSIHAIAFENDDLVIGYHAMSPAKYKKDIAIVSGTGTFVLEEYRKDIFIIYQLVEAANEVCIENGFEIVIDTPNENAFEYFQKFLEFQFLFNLPFKILPLRLNAFKKNFIGHILQFIWQIFLPVYLLLYRVYILLINSVEKSSKYELDVTGLFLNSRFRADHYTKYAIDNIQSVYRIYNENGVRTAYILDFREGNMRTSKALWTVVQKIRKEDNIDAILFVGTLKLSQAILFNIPPRFVPKQIPFTFRFLTESAKDKYSDMLNKSNWNFSLMNFDGR